MFGLFKKKAPAKPNASQVVPRIKHRNFLEAVASIEMPEAEKPYTEPLVGDLLVTYAFDLPDAFQMVRKADLTELGVAPTQLRSIAVANLKSRVGEGGYQGDPPVLRVVLGNNFDACALLYDDLWATLGEKIPPEIVVGVPHRDVVLMTTTASTKGGLEQIRAMVNEFHAKDEVHGLSRDLFVRRQNRWEIFEKASQQCAAAVVLIFKRFEVFCRCFVCGMEFARIRSCGQLSIGVIRTEFPCFQRCSLRKRPRSRP